MKRILSIALITGLITSCAQKKHDMFEVSGVVDNAAGKKVLLMETPYGLSQPVVLDSTLLINKGSFTLRARAKEEGIFRLMLENGPDVILINDNDHIKLHLDVNDYRNYTVEGSPASESLHKLFEDYRFRDSAILITFKKIDSVRALPGHDSVTAALQTKNDQEIEGLNSMLRNYINSTNSPSASLYALGIASQTIPNDEIKSMVNASAKRFPENAGLAKIKSMLEVKTTEKPENTAYTLLNQQAPDLTMNDINGKPVSISSFKGKYVLIDFWASWCGPCRMENPNVVAAYNQFKNKNFTILGVSLDQDKDAWQKAIEKDHLTWTHMSDLKQWESAAVKAYGFDGIPFNVLVDPAGKIIASSLRGADLTSKLAEVLK